MEPPAAPPAAWSKQTALWSKLAPTEKLEATHRIGSPAAPTACTDGERVVAYFGSFGLLAYDFAGAELWRHPLPAPVVEFGSSSSPILVGDLVIQLCDSDMDSCLIAVDKRTGKQAWKTARPDHRRGFATPFVWRHDGLEELIVNGSLKVSSYDPKTGALRWTSRGMARHSRPWPARYRVFHRGLNARALRRSPRGWLPTIRRCRTRCLNAALRAIGNRQSGIGNP